METIISLSTEKQNQRELRYSRKFAGTVEPEWHLGGLNRQDLIGGRKREGILRKGGGNLRRDEREKCAQPWDMQRLVRLRETGGGTNAEPDDGPDHAGLGVSDREARLGL